jgi:predicted aspartyl protease
MIASQREERSMRSRRPYFLMSFLAGLAVTGPFQASGIGRPDSVLAIRNPTGTVRFDLYQGYCIVVHGSAGTLKNLNFVLDTGTIHSTFNSRIAGKLNLRDEVPAGLVVMGGRERAEDATLPSLELGPVQRSNLQIVTADLSSFQRFLPVRIDAIIGLDVLGPRPFVIDYSAHVIRFGPLPALPVSLPLRLDRGLAVFDAEIDHRPVHLLLDTGASSLVLFKTDAQPGWGATTAAGREPDSIGDLESKQVWLRSLRVGPEEFLQEPALVARNPKPSQIDFDGLMSPVALGISRVSVDLEGGVLAFSR